jgi:hypothetical protein
MYGLLGTLDSYAYMISSKFRADYSSDQSPKKKTAAAAAAEHQRP